MNVFSPFWLQVLFNLKSNGHSSLFADLQDSSKMFTLFVPVNSAVNFQVYELDSQLSRFKRFLAHCLVLLSLQKLFE